MFCSRCQLQEPDLRVPVIRDPVHDRRGIPEDIPGQDRDPCRPGVPRVTGEVTGKILH